MLEKGSSEGTRGQVQFGLARGNLLSYFDVQNSPLRAWSSVFVMFSTWRQLSESWVPMIWHC